MDTYTSLQTIGSVSWSPRILLQQLQTRYGAAFHGTPIGVFRASGQQLWVRQLAYLALNRLSSVCLNVLFLSERFFLVHAKAALAYS